jgi:Tetratricopeptide repeat/PEGA domain
MTSIAAIPTEPTHPSVLAGRQQLTLLVLVSWICLTTASPAFAQGAREHFQRGLALVDAGRYEEAAIEFKRAYREDPHPRVLYNMGLAYAAIDDPVLALDALERYIATTTDPPEDRQRKRAEQLVSQLQERVAEVELTTAPIAATVHVDGRPISQSERGKLRLTGGKHTLRVSHPDHQAQVREFELVGGEQTTLSVELVETPSPRAAPPPGKLSVRCQLPAVSVFVDGKLRANTPLDGPLVVPSGQRDVSFRRPGYEFPTRTIVVPPEKKATLDCRPILRFGSDVAAGWIVIQAPAAARVLIDGHAQLRKVKMPTGPHRVVVSQAGYFTWSRTALIAEGQTTDLAVNLLPTSAMREALNRRVRSQRTWAAVIGSAGIVTGAAAFAHYRWNDGRYDEWGREQDELDAAWRAAPPFASGIDARQDQNDDRIESIQRADRVTVGLTAASTVLFATGLTLWLSAGGDDVADDGAPIGTGATFRGTGVAW